MMELEVVQKNRRKREGLAVVRIQGERARRKGGAGEIEFILPGPEARNQFGGPATPVEAASGASQTQPAEEFQPGPLRP